MSSEYIIELLQKGDARAIDVVYDEFYIPLKLTAYKITKDLYEAEDIAICSIESIFEKPHKFDTYQKLKAYLFTVTGNKCKKHLRAQRIHSVSHKEIAYLIEEDLEDCVEAQIIRGEFLQIIYNEIEKLPPKRKAVFKMLYMDGLSPDEIAVLLDMTKDSVYTTKLKALKQLRISLFK